MEQIGRHVVIDVRDVDPSLLDNRKLIERLLVEACELINATNLLTWSYAFTPQGVTALVGLAESHAAIHTSPELSLYSADIYTCGKLDPRPAARHIYKHLRGQATGWFHERGTANPPQPFDPSVD